jgi:hypothetical protein
MRSAERSLLHDLMWLLIGLTALAAVTGVYSWLGLPLIRDANPLSQFVEAARFSDSDNRANSVSCDVLAIPQRVYCGNRRATHDALAWFSKARAASEQ